MNLKEYILPKNSMIGGWYIPPPVCDDLVTLFKESKEHQTPGVVGPPLRIDPDEKNLQKFLFIPPVIAQLLYYIEIFWGILFIYMKRNIRKLKNLVNLEWGNLVKFSITSREKVTRNGILKEAAQKKIVV